MATQSWNPVIANNILAAYLRGTGNNITSPTAVYMKLHTNANSSAGPGSAGTANASSDTSRQTATFNAPSAGSITNATAFSWSSLSLSGAETLSFFSIWDASSAGTFLFSGTISATTVNNTDPFSIAASNLTVSLTVAS